MVTPRRGDIWWVRQPEHEHQATDTSKRRRPYLVVSGDPWNLIQAYPRITVCPLTGAENVSRRYDTDVFLNKQDTGLTKNSIVRCVEIYTLFRDLLLERAGCIPQSRMVAVERALSIYLTLLPSEQ